MDDGPKPDQSVEFVIVNPQGEPIPGFTPFTDLITAMRCARALETNNTVMRVVGDSRTPMSHQGPNGWNPRARKGSQLC